MPPQSPLLTRGRWLRAGVFSVALTVLAMTAHLLAGGRLPGLGVTLLAGLTVSCLTYPVTRSERSVAGVVATTIAAQAVLHVAFALPMAWAGAAATPGGAAGHMSMSAGTSGIGVVQAWAAVTADAPSPAMMTTHLLAAAVLALGLRHGERALLDVTAALRSLLGMLVAVVTGRLEPCFTGDLDLPRRGAFDAVQHAGTFVGTDRWGRAPPAMPVR